MKQWYASRTIWTNLISGIGTMGLVFGFDLGLTPEMQAQLVGGILVLVNVINIILRKVTKTAIGGPDA